MEERGTQSATLADLLPRAAAMYSEMPAIRFKQGEEWTSRSFREVEETVRPLALGLASLGVEKGDKVSILGNTRPEWTYADFAALSIGAIVVPIYQTNSPEECQYVLENSDAKVVIVEDDEQLEKIRSVRERLPMLEHVIRMTGSSDDAISLEDLAARGGGGAGDWEQSWSSVTKDDVCTFIYTSGTTGPPKGCVITHGNYRAMLDMINKTSVVEQEDVSYLYLPLAHSFALLVQLGSFDLGATLAYWERDPLKILPNLAELKPTYFPSVPRIFEKIYTAATSGMEKEGGLKKAIFDWAIRVGGRMREMERAGREPGFVLRKQYEFADRRVLSKIRGLFGGRLRLAVSGAAPINPDILRFFDSAGVLVLEGWGMTETSTAATISSPDDFKIGTIGKPFPGCDIRIAEDGEILVKGPNVFQGYYKNEEATQETIVDGWLHTGDLGSIDEDGFIRITGRKKDIIITAGGKNITPANLENEIKQHPLVS
ncbi:MAG TPA: long-chain fatty acid--CoA ligase, partial [Solirubrobacterales bacterium]